MKTQHQLTTAIWEADRHLEILKEALQDWDRAPAASLLDLERDRDRVRLVDQVLFRFTKLQDAVGERLIPATLAVLTEPYEDWPMRDRLNRLEKLGYLDVNEWLRWRETRNRLAHEYPDSPELRFATITAAIEDSRNLALRYQAWRSKLTAA